MTRFDFASLRRTRILAIGTFVASVAVSAWAWQLPGGFGTDPAPLPEPAGAEQAAAPAPQPIYTSRPTFRIPFQFNQEEISRLGAREIRLYASGDRGAEWHHVQTVEPSAQKFHFKASGDGEYWFTVQTVDRNNQLHPGGPVMQPGLIVVVDSTQPTLQLSLQQGQPGQVQLAWNSTDEAVDPDSLTLEYSQTGSTQWQRVAVLPAASGQTSWSVPLGGLVAVRGRIRDRAGNEATAESTVQISPAATLPAPARGIPNPREPVASTSPGLILPPPSLRQNGGALNGPGLFTNPGSTQPGQRSPSLTIPFESSTQLSPNPDPITSPGRSAISDPLAVTPGRSALPIPQPGVINFPDRQLQNRSGIRPGPASLSRGPSQSTQPDVWQHAQTVSPAPQELARVPGAADPFFSQSAGQPEDFRQTIQPGHRQDAFVSSQPGIARQQFPTYSQADEDPGYRTVNSRRFHIDYHIDDIGPSGVSSVELFVTQNNGEKWYRYGIDEDRRSPFEVEVPGDGVYGFSMRVVSGAGLVDPPPQPRQRPDIVIVTDSSPPVVNLLPLRQGTGQNANRILITWDIQDRKLAERPVSLSYSANPEGPWEPIAEWMPNTGQHIWTVNAGIAPRLYIRLIARDAAGNMAKVDTPQPVLVDLARPTARIVDVESSITSQVGNY